jgi:hypothetical protein
MRVNANVKKTTTKTPKTRPGTTIASKKKTLRRPADPARNAKIPSSSSSSATPKPVKMKGKAVKRTSAKRPTKARKRR